MVLTHISTVNIKSTELVAMFKIVF